MPHRTVAQSFVIKDRVPVWYIANKGVQDMDGAMERLQDFKRLVKTDGIWAVLHDLRLLKGFPDPGNWSLFTRGVRLTIPAGLRWAIIRGGHPRKQLDMMVRAGREAGAHVKVFDDFRDAARYVGLGDHIEDPLDNIVLID